MTLKVIVMTTKYNPVCSTVCGALDAAGVHHMKVNADHGYHIWPDCPGKPAIRIVDESNGKKELFRDFWRSDKPIDTAAAIALHQNPPVKIGIEVDGQRSKTINLTYNQQFQPSPASQDVHVKAYNLDGSLATNWSGPVKVRSTQVGEITVNLVNGFGNIDVDVTKATNITLSIPDNQDKSVYVSRYDQEIVLLSFR